MHAKKLVAVCVLGTFGLMLLGGCIFSDQRTSNQGGSNALQATTKFTSDRLDTLNPDDVQVLADLAPSLTGVEIPQVTDAQAAALVQFIADNNIVSMADIQNLDPNTVVISADVQVVLDALSAQQTTAVGG